MEFQKVLLQVEQALSHADVQALAFLCDDLVSRDLSNISSAKDLFTILMDKDRLNSEDTSLLTELLHTSGRQDVIRQLDHRIAPQPTESLVGPYRKLLFSLSENITEEDLKLMKFLLRNTLPRTKLQDKMTTLQLLREMEKEDILSSQNLDTLNEILSHVCPNLTRRIDQFKREVNDQTANQLSDQSNIYQETGAGKPLSRLVVGGASHKDTSNQHLFCTPSVDVLIPPSYFCKVPPSSTEESGIASPSEHPESLMASTEGLENLSLTSSTDDEVRSHHLSFSSVPENMNLKQDIPPSSAAVTAMELPQYDMKGGKRGVCLIINNHDFSKSVKKLSNRDGTEVDESRLKEVFDWLGFELEIQRDCTQQQILSLLDDLGQRDHSQADCFVCCLLSHGMEGSVYGVDGREVGLKQLTKPFSGLVCPSLKEKPKLFFIQACQGIKEQQVVYIQSDGPVSRSLSTDAVVPNSIPADGDFLLGMATLPDYAAFRDRKEGTWFIQSLCEKLQLLVPQGVDLLSIMTEVNNHVSKKAFGSKKQMPQPVYSLRKKVIFPIPSSTVLQGVQQTSL